MHGADSVMNGADSWTRHSLLADDCISIDSRCSVGPIQRLADVVGRGGGLIMPFAVPRFPILQRRGQRGLCGPSYVT